MTGSENREYGAGGWVGIGTPQANPTVEIEMRRLLSADIEPLTVRLVSQSENSDDRLVEYLERLPDFMNEFDTMPLDAFGFACTGSTYLVGHAREAEIVAAAETAFGFPVITAAEAIRRTLHALGARRIALVAPYPQHLVDASQAHWQAIGFGVSAVRRIDLGSLDTRLIYGLRSADALAAMESFDPGDADVILLSGTGMPTINALKPAEAMFGRPVVSSNLCLARVLGETLSRRV